MLKISQENNLEIEIPENVFTNVFTKLKSILTVVEEEGSKNNDSTLQIIKNLFDIAITVDTRLKNPIANQLVEHK